MNFDDFDLWWRERGDAKQLAEMRAQLKNALSQNDSRDIEYSIRWRLARFFHFQAMFEFDNANRGARVHFSEGARQAQRAINLRKDVQRETFEADFWWSVNAIEAARLRSKLSALSVLPRATGKLQFIAEYYEEFHFAGAQRVLGRITHSKPRIFGGGARKSFSRFEAALDVARNSTTLLYYAQALDAANETEKTAKVLHEIMVQSVNNEWKWEQARDQQIAARLLKTNEPRT